MKVTRSLAPKTLPYQNHYEVFILLRFQISFEKHIGFLQISQKVQPVWEHFRVARVLISVHSITTRADISTIRADISTNDS